MRSAEWGDHIERLLVNEISRVRRSLYSQLLMLPQSNVVIFADGILLYRTIHSSCDDAVLQTDLDRVHDWCSSNQMTLNATKTKVMHITRKRKPDQYPDYTLNDAPLAPTSSYKYLGVTISSDGICTLTQSYLVPIDFLGSFAPLHVGPQRRQYFTCPDHWYSPFWNTVFLLGIRILLPKNTNSNRYSELLQELHSTKGDAICRMRSASLGSTGPHSSPEGIMLYVHT